MTAEVDTRGGDWRGGSLGERWLERSDRLPLAARAALALR